MALTTVQQKFVVHWGEMGARWGINRTVAQVHALLFLSSRAMHAEEIAATLGVARSNVSNSLRELQGWRIVRVVHILGDRRDHFESLKDVWEMFRIIVEQRKRREVDPTLQLLRNCLEELKREGNADAYVRERLEEMTEFFETGMSAYEEVKQLPPSALRGLLRMRGKLRKLLRPGAA